LATLVRLVTVEGDIFDSHTLTCSSLKLILLPATCSEEIGLVQVPYAAVFLAELISLVWAAQLTW
jgi:hypothetical protein